MRDKKRRNDGLWGRVRELVAMGLQEIRRLNGSEPGPMADGYVRLQQRDPVRVGDEYFLGTAGELVRNDRQRRTEIWLPVRNTCSQVGKPYDEKTMRAMRRKAAPIAMSLEEEVAMLRQKVDACLIKLFWMGRAGSAGAEDFLYRLKTNPAQVVRDAQDEIMR